MRHSYRADYAPPGRRFFAAAVFGLAGALALAGCGHNDNTVQAGSGSKSPQGAEIIVPPDKRADVPAPFKTTVEKVETSIGKHVDRGDLLVVLSVPSAETYHEQTKANEKAAETAYANARNAYSTSVNAAQKQVDAAKAALKAAQQAAAASAAPSTTTQTTPNGGSVTTTTPAPSTATSPDVAQAQTQLAQAEQALQQAIAERDAQIAPYRQQLEAARAANSSARAGERAGNVTAPLSGTVLALNAQPGAQVGTDTKVPIATIVNLDALKVQMPLSQNQMATVKDGTPVTLTFAELPGKTFEGKVSSITSQVNAKLGGLMKESRTVAVIDFKNTDRLVRPGMAPTVQFGQK